MASQDRLAGQRLGRFQLGRRLGSGGAASVYQAYDLVQGRTVALKVLLPGADAVSHSRFRQEAQMASVLNHPHIVQTLQVGDIGERARYGTLIRVRLLKRCG